jgi:predicted TIM-barrel fold metal-dependent hydrolase
MERTAAHRSRASRTTSGSARVRERLDHPIVDADAHVVEFMPAILDRMREIGGARLAADFGARYFRDESGPVRLAWYDLSREQRRDRRVARPGWWGLPARNTLDRATALLPGLFYERLDELGVDFSIVYPTVGLEFPHVQEDELRRCACRALNAYHAEAFGTFSDRLTPAAAIPMHTPAEAIEELEHAVGALGLKVVAIAGFVERAVKAPVPASREPYWYDGYGLDSEYDYDPVWSKCLELGVAPTVHSSFHGRGTRRSVSNFMFNHLGMFSAAHEHLAKSLLMGGVTRRFPALRFAFLEAGVTWALSLLNDTIGYWNKRGADRIRRLDPHELDLELLGDLFRRYGGPLVEKYAGASADMTSIGGLGANQEDPATLDEWAPCRIERVEDFRELFVRRFYLGCEADDPTTPIGLDPELIPLGEPLRAIFSSDFGHWDVDDMREVVEEAHEESGLDPARFRDFAFANAVRLHGGANPDFFRGTTVEAEAASLLGAP